MTTPVTGTATWTGQAPHSGAVVSGRWCQPAVELGDVVLWHDEQSAAASACALVTWVGTDQVSLAVLVNGYRNFEVKEGVRHRDHPDRSMVSLADVGVWSHRPNHLKLFPLLYDTEVSAPAEVRE